MSETTVPDPVATSTEFATEIDDDRWHKQRMAEIGRTVTLGTGALTVLAILGVAAMVCYLTFTVVHEHTQRDRDANDLKSRTVTVWCYADPNRNDATSQFTGSRDQVRGLCPDAYGR